MFVALIFVSALVLGLNGCCCIIYKLCRMQQLAFEPTLNTTSRVKPHCLHLLPEHFRIQYNILWFALTTLKSPLVHCVWTCYTIKLISYCYCVLTVAHDVLVSVVKWCLSQGLLLNFSCDAVQWVAVLTKDPPLDCRSCEIWKFCNTGGRENVLH